jgi:hypothetical protein
MRIQAINMQLRKEFPAIEVEIPEIGISEKEINSLVFPLN